MENNEEKIIQLREWEAEKTNKIFQQITQEIRDGALQLHFVDNNFLFSKTDEILHFSLQGEKLDLKNPDYQKVKADSVKEIEKNIDEIANLLSDYPQNDCLAVRKSLEKIKNLASQIRV